MNVEFHYYAVYILALEAGFDDRTAFIMANASQEVDASTTPVRFSTSQAEVDVPVTQNYLFWDDSVSRNVYLPYHFIPGDPDAAASARRDGKRNAYAVTANSAAAKELLVSALKDKNPYLIGVALHSFADTWAHQNFCGLLDDWNDTGSSSLAAGLPPAGHLQALALPDDPAAIWSDDRLIPRLSRVINRERFTAAAQKIYRYLCVYRGRGFVDDELIVARLAAVWAKQSRDERLADYAICWDVQPYEAGLWRRQAGAPLDASPFAGLRHYDKVAWARAQLAGATGRGTTPTVQTDASFFSTDLYTWCEAATLHRKRAIAILERRGL
ncbi:MAG: hypothetical protein JXM71_13005 [Spirochaetales bacterium]|nr:hypothetical protein [Spirochaetales bacterium]